MADSSSLPSIRWPRYLRSAPSTSLNRLPVRRAVTLKRRVALGLTVSHSTSILRSVNSRMLLRFGQSARCTAMPRPWDTYPTIGSPLEGRQQPARRIMRLRSSPARMPTFEVSRRWVSVSSMPRVRRALRRRAGAGGAAGPSALRRATMLRSKIRSGSFCRSQWRILERARWVRTKRSQFRCGRAEGAVRISMTWVFFSSSLSWIRLPSTLAAMQWLPISVWMW